jgi:outer membrane lipoprotein-sorting protein
MKFFAFTSLLGTGLVLFAALSPQTIVEKQAAVLKEAQSLKVAYTFQHLPGTRVEYTLTYSKPNYVLMEGPDKLIQSDGKTLFEYNKTAKTYTETAITPEMLARRAQAEEVLAWAGFFAVDMLKNASGFTGGTARILKGGIAATEVTFTLGGTTPRTLTLYVDDKLGIARGMSMKTPTGDVLAMATSIEVGKEAVPAEKFAFVAPAGATKIVAPVADPTTGYATVQGIFQANCMGCHGGRGAKGGFSVASYQDVMKGGRGGLAVIAGDPDNSSLVKYLTGEKSPQMPQGKAPLSGGDIEKIKAWIKAGAKE